MLKKIQNLKTFFCINPSKKIIFFSKSKMYFRINSIVERMQKLQETPFMLKIMEKLIDKMK